LPFFDTAATKPVASDGKWRESERETTTTKRQFSKAKTPQPAPPVNLLHTLFDESCPSSFSFSRLRLFKRARWQERKGQKKKAASSSATKAEAPVKPDDDPFSTKKKSFSLSLSSSDTKFLF
jgi:hypothetical protein